MAKVISKDKPKGTEYNKLKKMKKAKRIQKMKDDRRRTENKRINAENRKERRMENELFSKISLVKIINFSKGMLHIEIEEAIEKRAIFYKKRENDIRDFLEFIDEFEVKILGRNIPLKKISNYFEIKEDLMFWIQNDNR